MKKRKLYRIGAAAYVLWGLVHVAGGAMLLSAAAEGGAGKAMEMLSGALPAAERTDQPGPVAAAIVSFHAWNVLWIGVLVILVAILQNGRNTRAGFWTNLGVVGAADAGMVATLLAPGLISPPEAAVGLTLAGLGAVFTAAGRLMA